VKVFPAIVIVPLRWTAVALAAYVQSTPPLPVPEVTEPSVIHESLLTAVQAQEDWVVTVTFVPAPASRLTCWLVEPIEYEQPAA
jgi:hypothetical protein